MKVKIIKLFKPEIIRPYLYEYLVAIDEMSNKKYLLRRIPEHELHWYLDTDDKLFCEEINSVIIQVVLDIEQAEERVKSIWGLCCSVNKERSCINETSKNYNY